MELTSRWDISTLLQWNRTRCVPGDGAWRDVTVRMSRTLWIGLGNSINLNISIFRWSSQPTMSLTLKAGHVCHKCCSLRTRACIPAYVQRVPFWRVIYISQHVNCAKWRSKASSTSFPLCCVSETTFYACPMGAHASVCLEHACPCAACVACDREQTEKAELCRGISCIITERFSERLDEF